MPLPSIEQFGMMLAKALQTFVKEVEELVSDLIRRLKELIEELR
jgi:hypothetical protein